MFCQKCGNQNEDSRIFCVYCGTELQKPEIKKPKKKKRKKFIVFAVLAVLIIAVIALFGGGGSSGSGAEINNEGNVVLPDSSVLTKSEFIDACESFAYDVIARSPDTYKDKNVKFTGEVIQVQESGSSVAMRLNVTKDEDIDLWTDTIYVTYKYKEGEAKILEDDIITLYGICTGTMSYESIFGEQITIPSVDALYVSLAK